MALSEHNILFGIITIGKIKRETADTLLQPKPSGMYLVRLSHKIWGYTISVKGIYNTIQLYSIIIFSVTNSIKHYIVDASTPGVYKFIGKHQPEFPSLLNLIQYYRYLKHAQCYKWH